jgi:hypothetical protein
LLVCYKHCHIRCCICVMRFYWDLLRIVNIYCFPIYFLPIWCSRNVAKKKLLHVSTFLYIVRQMLQSDVAFYENATYKKKLH